MDVHPSWNSFTEDSTMIIPMEKQECLVSETSSRLQRSREICSRRMHNMPSQPS
jgi:hypothetical protein